MDSQQKQLSAEMGIIDFQSHLMNLSSKEIGCFFIKDNKFWKKYWLKKTFSNAC